MRKLVAAVIVFVVLLVSVSIAANVLVDQKALRARVAIALKQETGLDLKVEQSAVQFLPWPSIVAQNVVLSRAGDVPVFQAQSLHAGLSVLALLQREIRFQDFVADGARIFVHRRADGRMDWMAHALNSQEEEAPLPVNGFQARRIEAHWAVALDALHLTNSTVQWDDRRLGVSGGFAVQAVDLAGLRTPSPWINLAGQHAGTPFTLKGHVSALGALWSSALPAGGAPWSFSLAATLGPDSHRDWLELDGSLQDPRHVQGMTVHLRGEWLDLQDAEELFPHAGLPHVPALGGDVTLAGNVDWSALRAQKGGERQGWWPVPGLTPVALHLHVGSMPVWGVELGHVTVAADSVQSPLTVETDIEWRGRDWHASGQAGTLGGMVGFVQSAGQGTSVPVQAEIRSQSLSLSATLNAPHAAPPLNSQDALVVTLKGAVGAASQLMVQGRAGQLSTPWALLHDVTLGGHIALGGEGAYALKGLDFESREAALSGDVSVAFLAQGTPHIHGVLTSSHCDVDVLRQMAPAEPASTDEPTAHAATVPQAVLKTAMAAGHEVQGPDGVSTTAVRNTVSVPHWVKRLRAQDMDVAVSVDQLHVGGADYTGVSGHVASTAGHAILHVVKGQGAGVTLGGLVDVDASIWPMQMHLQAASLMLPAHWVQQVVSMPDMLHGAVQIVGDVRGQGYDVQSVRDTLEGELGLSMVDGQVSGTLLARLAGPQAASFIGSGQHGLRCLGAHMALLGGKAEIDHLGLQAGNVQVSGQGQVGLVAQTLTLHVQPSVELAGAAASVPLMLDGPWTNVTVQPERDADGNAQLTLGSAAPAEQDPCVAWLAAARKDQPGPQPVMAAKHQSRAGDLLKALGVWH
ncbi:AsmA family protein [Neokomagataea thailandica]|uniref:Lipopolysaccharide biogenesis periplasmic protein AsmA n=1 Tax=Neokomagataea tanensis NBRC 106556 TaxID=1223519 RepID=A0ABQ0QLI3_9PROT|nr:MULTISPECIES: AsmA family protein [Neokomagataea]GBR49341.1 lipopolysaccharide biogenesis periplasmic protein AsmA [Neokomagataea tanensis NBRC 106556]